MHIKKIYRNEAVEERPFNLTNTSAVLSKATGLDWSGIQFGRVIYSSANSRLAKEHISVEDAFKLLEVGKQAAIDAGWRVQDEPYARASVLVSKGPAALTLEFKTFDEYKEWVAKNPKGAAAYHVVQIGLPLRDGLKKKASVNSIAEKWLKEVLAEFNKNPNRYKDGYEIEDLMDTIGIESDELEKHEKELDYVVAGLAKAGFEML